VQKDDLKSITSKHFDAYAANWEERLKDHCYLIRYKTVQAMLKRAITKVVDLGCGTGDYTAIFDPLVEYIGIDNSPGMIEKASSLYPGKRFLLEDVEKTSIPDNYADCVLAIGLFEYLDSPNRLVDEIRRITKKGGQVIATFQNKRNVTKTRISLSARPAYYAKKLARRLLGKKDRENPLAPGGYVKDTRIIHRKFNEEDVSKLFSRFTPDKIRYAKFDILRYLTGIPFTRLDEKVSAFLTITRLDRLFPPYSTVLFMSFLKD